jgi:diacylglycerol kinase family enzyme
VAVAGGDGSLAAVAQAARAHDLPFVCIPAGTRNHFARDLGLDPDDPIAALDALSDGVEGLIDVGEVNGRAFLNNVSLGIYGEAIRRAGYRDAKVRTLLETARPVLGPATEISALKVVDDLGVDHRGPAIVLVSNNPYAPGGPLTRGGRPTLSGGQLGVIVIDGPAAGLRPSGRAWSSASLRIDGPAVVHAGIDGEAVELSPPIEFAVRPTALRVRTPRRSRAARGTARVSG